EARARAEQAIKQAGPADAVAVFLLDRTARPLVSFEQWSATAVGERVNLALQRVRDAEPGWGGTHLGHGLLGVVDALAESAGRGQRTVVPGPRRLVLITDLQEGAHLDGLQGFDWPKGLEVVLEPVKARRPTNAGLQFLIENEEALKPAGDEEIKVRVTNAA